MRAAAIFGLGCSPKELRAFQTDESIAWRIGLPSATDQADIILLFGGDGTIHRQLSQLVKLKLPVLIVPAGSGNDFARALGLRRVRDSMAAWRCGGRRLAWKPRRHNCISAGDAGGLRSGMEGGSF